MRSADQVKDDLYQIPYTREWTDERAEIIERAVEDVRDAEYQLAKKDEIIAELKSKADEFDAILKYAEEHGKYFSSIVEPDHECGSVRVSLRDSYNNCSSFAHLHPREARVVASEILRALASLEDT